MRKYIKHNTLLPRTSSLAEEQMLPAIQAVIKQEMLPAIRALRPQLEKSDSLSGAMAAGERTIMPYSQVFKFHRDILFITLALCFYSMFEPAISVKWKFRPSAVVQRVKMIRGIKGSFIQGANVIGLFPKKLFHGQV